MHSASFLLGAALISRYNTANHRCPQSDAEGEGGDSAKPPGVGIGVGTWKAGGHRPLPWGTLASLWAAIPVLRLLSHLCHDAPPKSGAPPEPLPQSPQLAQMMFSGRLTQIRKMAPGGSDPFSKGWGQGRSIQRGCGAGYGRDLRVALA